ncbi:hypothetical protein [Kitasatospora sp. NPDC050543]|uniref:hypothetical protein n=1 Tax=Kitasatospora sp. NPDC050543 TaxID=3364054 RepID=UPI0037A19468
MSVETRSPLPEAQAGHRPTGTHAERYLARLSELGTPPPVLVEASRRSQLLTTAYGDRFLPRPVFLDAADRTQLATDLNLLHDLLASLPERLFDGSRSDLARAVGMAPAQVAAVGRSSGPAPVRIARADLYRTRTGFRLLEFNMGSALGGFENAELNRAMLTRPELQDFADEEQLSFTDTLRGFVATMLAACPQVTAERPVVALADWPSSYETLEPRLRFMADLMADMGVDAVPCHVGELHERGGRLEIHGRPVDIVYRFFLIEDLIDGPDAPALVEPVLAAAERGTVALFAPMDSELYGNKGTLALLSDDRHRASFTTAELDFIDRFLPWTRHVRRTATAPGGEQVDLLRHAEQHQDDLVLKPTLMHGGIGVVPGWTVSPQEWSARLSDALDGPFVLQQRVRPLAEPFPALDRPQIRDLVLNWGVFLVDAAATGTDGFGGAMVRGTADPEVGVVSMGNGAAVGCCFHQEQR